MSKSDEIEEVAKPKSSERSAKNMASEAQSGKEDLVKVQRKEMHAIKNGAHTGITKDFGKPQIEDDLSGKSKAKTGMDGVISTSREYWQNDATASKAEGGIVGNSKALGAQIMGKGVDAFEAINKQTNKAFPDGIVQPAREFWQDAAKDGQKQGGLAGNLEKVVAKSADGLLAVSGLGNVEAGTQKVISDIDHVASVDKLNHDAGWLVADAALSATTFLPGASGVKALAQGETVLRTAAAGAEISGMLPTGLRVADSAAGKITQAIKDTLPGNGEKLSKEHLHDFVEKAKEIGKGYGIQIKEGGIIGESKGNIDSIHFSSIIGGPHEVAHVVQQLQTRAAALESTAAKAEKSVADLTSAERALAFEKIVKPFEDVAYNQHEMWAGEAHSWGQTSTHYAQVLTENVHSFEAALAKGVVPEASGKLGSAAYGELPNLLGRSQAEIAKNIASPGANILGHSLDSQWKDNGDLL